MQSYSNNFNFPQEEESLQLQLKKKNFEFTNDAPYEQQFFGIGEYRQEPSPNINFDQSDSYKNIDIFFNEDDDNKIDLFDAQNQFEQQAIDFNYCNQIQQENLPQIAFDIQNYEQHKEIDSMRMSHAMPSIENNCHEQIEAQELQNNYILNLQQQQYQQQQYLEQQQLQQQELLRTRFQPQPIQNKKIKRKQNGQKDMFKTKNIPKVFGNAFRNYVSSNSTHVQYVCGLNNVSFKDFNNFVKKLNFYSIKGMREAFQQSPEDFRADQLKKIYRILVNKFLREDTWTWFLSNKRISNCRRLCNFRFYILRGLSCPAAFISWED